MAELLNDFFCQKLDDFFSEVERSVVEILSVVQTKQQSLMELMDDKCDADIGWSVKQLSYPTHF